MSNKPKIIIQLDFCIKVENFSFRKSEIEAKTVYAETRLRIYFSIKGVLILLSIRLWFLYIKKDMKDEFKNKAKNKQNLQIMDRDKWVHFYNDLVEMLIAGGFSDKMIRRCF